MAHFAELNNENVVLRVVAVCNAECQRETGEQEEALGQAFCASHFGGRWVQTSYNAQFRKRYAGIGFTYDERLDAFIPPKPYASWSLDESTCTWVPPSPAPTHAPHVWDEAAQAWVQVQRPVP